MSKRVLIVGATSAIAEAVARRYASEGASLFLAARNIQRAAAIAEDLRVRGAAAVRVGAYDALVPESAEDLVAIAWDALAGIDVALIAHGSLPDQPACATSVTLTRRGARRERPERHRPANPPGKPDGVFRGRHPRRDRLGGRRPRAPEQLYLRGGERVPRHFPRRAGPSSDPSRGAGTDR